MRMGNYWAFPDGFLVARFGKFLLEFPFVFHHFHLIFKELSPLKINEENI
jgi:hypothetical protein